MTVSSVAAASAIAALETLLAGIQQRLSPIVGAALQHASGSLDTVAETVAAPAAAAIQAATINAPLDGTNGPIDWQGLYDALDHIDTRLWSAQQPIQDVVGSAQQSVQAHTDAILPSAGDLLGGALAAFSDLVSGLLGELSTTDDLWTSLYARMREGFGTDVDPLTRFTADVGAAIVHKLSDILGQSIHGYQIIGHALTATDPPAILDPDAMAGRMQDWPDWVKVLVDIALEGSVVYSILAALGAPKVDAARQAANEVNPLQPLSPVEAASGVRRGLIESDFGRQEARRSGVSPDLFDVMVSLTQSFLTAENYVEMWRRSGDDSHLDMLHRLGLDDNDIDRLRQLALAIPTPSDLVRFMVRDAFDDNASAIGQYDTDFQEKINPDWNRRVGITDETLRLYWRSHWSLPSPSMFYAMFHRGLITQEQLTDALKTADWAPGWIANLIGINYLVPSRIDVRRMWEAGVITDRADLVKRHTDMGYSPADADVLATFVEQLKAQQDENKARLLRGPIVQSVIKSYADGAEDYATAHDHLVTLGLADDTATYELQQADLFRERDRADRIKASIGREYTRGFISHEDAQSKLDSFGFEQNEADGLFASWDLDRELSDLSAEAHHQRDLTRAEVIEAYTDRIIDSADAAAHLTQMGYDGQEAATIIALADYRSTRADQKAAQQALKTEYLKRTIEQQQVTDTLYGFGYSQARIDAMVAEWTLEREAARPTISTGTLERIIMQGIVPVASLEPELRRRGYSDQDVHWLLTLWSTDVSVAADKLAEQQRQFNIREARLNAAQQAQQQRFQETQAQQQALQTQRLQAQQASQSATQAFQVQRDAAAAQVRLQASHDAQSAVAARQDKAIAAAAQRSSIAAQQHQRALDAQAQIAQRAQAAQDARQQASLSAQAERLQTQINARASAAAAAAQNQQALQAARDATQKQILAIRDQIAQAAQIRANAARIATEQRQEAARVRQENRAQARQQIGAAQVAQQKAALDALQRNRDAAVADLNAKLATLEATAATQRQAAALQAQQAAQQLLTANIPPGTFTDTAT